jgi:hypothetical protein
MLLPVASRSFKFRTSATIDHVGFQRSSAWCMPVYDSAVDLGALHCRPSQDASGRRAHAPSVFDAVWAFLPCAH